MNHRFILNPVSFLLKANIELNVHHIALGFVFSSIYYPFQDLHSYKDIVHLNT